MAAPAAWWHGAAAGKVAVFVGTRAALGMASAGTETLLFRCAVALRLKLPVKCELGVALVSVQMPVGL